MKRTYYFLLTILIVLASGCRSKESALKNYYLIEFPQYDSEQSVDSPFIDAWCIVDDANIQPPYNSSRIAIKNQSHQINYFQNHEWAVPPSNIITPLIKDYLNSNNIFNKADSRFWQVHPSFRLTTNIKNMEVISKEGVYSAHLNIEFNLISIYNETVLISHSVVKKDESDRRNLNSIASIFSEMIYNELAIFTENLIENREDLNEYIIR
ncbi:hypothetical protein QA597_00455 [Marinilabiliaceae bacterium ANBcel2]|nr:hypothetical protein [Marinilabiliaceae bacterium ANBcel2]